MFEQIIADIIASDITPHDLRVVLDIIRSYQEGDKGHFNAPQRGGRA